jgi:hypothetical protein
MGRIRIPEEQKAKNFSISLSPEHKKMVEELITKLNIKKISDLFQKLVEEAHKENFK